LIGRRILKKKKNQLQNVYQQKNRHINKNEFNHHIPYLEAVAQIFCYGISVGQCNFFTKIANRFLKDNFTAKKVYCVWIRALCLGFTNFSVLLHALTLTFADIKYTFLKFYYCFFLLLVYRTLLAQVSLTGYVYDQTDSTSLTGVGVLLLQAKDSTLVAGTTTDNAGKFTLEVNTGTYYLKYSLIGYKTVVAPLEVGRENIHVPDVFMKANTRQLKEILIEQTAVRVKQKGDTTEFLSSAFKTNRDATTEELIQKMPGISIENGTVKAKGEEVKKVLVDGKPFFGADPNTALKNLPAEIVDKVQVFDQLSDQSRFTGFNDGNEQRTINIITKPNRNNGVFGKLYAGYGYLDAHRYQAGVNLNRMKGNQRITFLALSNNINQQNFSMEDLMGLSGLSGSTGGMGRMRMMGGGMRPDFLQNSPAGNFMVGNLRGISTSHATGIQYSDQWGKQVKISASYFFNLTNNSNRSEILREFFARGENATRYQELSLSSLKNIYHRLNARMEYEIDSNRSLFITPKVSIQQNSQKSSTWGVNSLTKGDSISSLKSDFGAKNLGYNVSMNALYQQKLKKLGRTFSVDVTAGVNNSDGNGSLSSENIYMLLGDTVELNQISDNAIRNYSATAVVAYTEPVSNWSLMQFSYTPFITWSNRLRNAFDYDSVAESYSRQNIPLSNNFDNSYMSQRVGFSYRLRNQSDAFNLSVGASVQYADLRGEQRFPFENKVRKTFHNLLPNASVKYSFSKEGSVRVNYTTSTTPPTITQLQNVVDNTNPLFISSGNPDLKQDYRHHITIRFNNVDPTTMHMFYGFTSFTYTENFIGNSTTIALRDTLLRNNILVNAGAQLSKPVNLTNSIQLRSFMGYGLPLKFIRCNLNFHSGITYARTPSLINGNVNLANTVNVPGGLVLSSNIHEKLDFTISYMANYNVVKNSLRQQQNNNFFFHTADVRFNWNFWKGFVFNTTVNNTLYAGVSQGFNQNFFLWNASLAYKFLKDRSLELKVGVFDILGQNNSISRTVNETFLEDVRTDVLQRYVMLTLTYNLRHFKEPIRN
jgi:hypothetical protein